MPPLRTCGRTVLSPITEFDLTSISSLPLAAPRSLAVSQNLIYLGTAAGTILLLSPTPSPQLLRCASLTNRPIDSITVLPDISRILALSDGSLFLLDPLLQHPPRKLGFAKDVVAVATRVPYPNSSNPIEVAPKADASRLGLLSKLSSGIRVNGVAETREGGTSCFIAVAAGKKLMVMELLAVGAVDEDSENGGVSVRVREIPGFDGVKTIGWIGDSIVVGSVEGYTLVSTRTGEGTLIFSLPEASGPPRLKVLWRSKEMLLLMDNVGVAVDAVGQPVGGSLVFGSVPESIAEMSSYVAVVGDGMLHLHRRKMGDCVQSLSFGKGGTGPCIVAGEDQGNGEILVIATPYKCICYHKLSVEEQIKDLLRKKNFKEAVCLVEEFDSEGEMTKEVLSFVHAQVGFLLLFDLHFEDAVKHFLLSETMQPSEIFPFVMRDPNRWSHLWKKARAT